MFSWHLISLNDFGGVKNILDVVVHSGEQFSFPMNVVSCYSEQMDVLESFNVIMNVMPPVVFWNTIVLVAVISWCGQGFIMMVVPPW